ncbi:MAG: DegT/DnrJ/EryC1/StrS family aminotransferase [Planctomycetota bacterium]
MIPVNSPLIDGDESRYLQECIATGWLSAEGGFVEQFEREFAARVGRAHGVAVSSGTAALDVAVAALGLGPGDEVIVPTFTIISCVAAILRAGATPIFVDSDARTWNMDVDQIEPLLNRRTRAIMAVHTYGLPVEMEPVLTLARDHGLHVIEDAAEAHGLQYRGEPCGSFGDISTFSFYANKLVTTGEGGMVLTDDPAIAERCRSLRNLCFGSGRRFVHEELGWNYRMSNLQAAVGVAQLKQLDRFIRLKRAMGQRYSDRLTSLAAITLQPARTEHAENGYWVYGVVLEDHVPLDAAEAMRRLAQRGIGTRPFFWPMHEQPVLKKLGLADGKAKPVSERLARRGFYLPSGLGLSEAEIDTVCDEVCALLADFGIRT